MIFSSPSWVPPISGEIPSSVPIGQFALDRNVRLPPQPHGRGPFVDAISGKWHPGNTLEARVDLLARALAKDLGWSPNEGSPWDKVVAIYSLNTIDYFVLCWAIHRLNGICMPIHSTCTVTEIKSHMTTARCQVVFTCQGLVTTCLEAADALSLPYSQVYILPLPDDLGQDAQLLSRFKNLEQLVTEGSQLDPLEPLQWEHNQGKSQVAYLCATSGTSGKQKLAKITHFGLITNISQMGAFEGFHKSDQTETTTGAIPFSHSYGLALGHLVAWRGDSLIVFPRFDIQMMLKSIPQFKIERLYLVPPILAALATNSFLFQLFDLSSVTSVVTGAAALNRVLAERLHELQPKWKFLHAYGLTESCVIATFTSPHDVWHGSSGSLLPGFQLRLVGPDGRDSEGYENPGEVLFMSPGLFIGYLGDEEATRKTFDANGWLRTGDVGVMRRGPNGTEHLFILDRIKDMIKVKGMQVVPADIEIVLISHPAVVEAAVIGVPDELAGERPQAFVARSKTVMCDVDEEELLESIDEHVQSKLHETHWLHERIVFLPEIPKSQNGKILKRELRTLVPVR